MIYEYNIPHQTADVGGDIRYTTYIEKLYLGH